MNFIGCLEIFLAFHHASFAHTHRVSSSCRVRS
jgi:hypothetical protein